MFSVPATVSATCLRPAPLAPGDGSGDGSGDGPARAVMLSVTDQRTRSFFEPLAALASLAACDRRWRCVLDAHTVWLALMGLQVHNALPPPFSCMLLARHIHAARNHPHLTRRILCGLNSQTQPETALAEASKTKTMAMIFVQLTPEDEATYWREKFLRGMKTSAVPSLAQWQDVASAYVFMRETNGDALSSSALVELIVGGKNGTPDNKILSAFVFALLADQNLALRVCRSARSQDGSKKVEEDKAPEEAPRQLVSIPKGAERLLVDVASIGHALGFLHGIDMNALLVTPSVAKWNLDRKLRLSRSTTRALARALANCSELQLYDLLKPLGCGKHFSSR